MHWHAQRAVTIYSTLVVDNVTTCCFFEDQETTPCPILNTYPKVHFYRQDHRRIHYPCMLKVLGRLLLSCIKMPSSVVPFKYLMILLATNQYDIVGIDMYLLIRLTPYIKSGRVTVKYMRIPTTCLKSIVSNLLLSPSFDIFVPATMGFLTELLLAISNLLNTSQAYLLWQINI